MGPPAGLLPWVAEVPDVFTWLGPLVFAEAMLPLAPNATEITTSVAAFAIAFMLLSKSGVIQTAMVN
jgi:hypothetical protein